MLRIYKNLFVALFVAFCTYGANAATPKTILVVGDSISAAYGLKPEEGWVALLQKKLDADKRGIKVINGSVSGDTTANGLARLPALLSAHRPTTVVIALGGNDALRGSSIATMQKNLEAMITSAQKAKAKVVVTGLQIPPNFGPTYTKQFEGAFVTVAQKTKSALVPSILAPLGTSLEFFQADKIHPTANAQPKILAHLWPTLEKAL
jgi:acyl-CoA thioesterase-1